MKHRHMFLPALLRGWKSLAEQTTGDFSHSLPPSDSLQLVCQHSQLRQCTSIETDMLGCTWGNDQAHYVKSFPYFPTIDKVSLGSHWNWSGLLPYQPVGFSAGIIRQGSKWEGLNLFIYGRNQHGSVFLWFLSQYTPQNIASLLSSRVGSCSAGTKDTVGPQGLFWAIYAHTLDYCSLSGADFIPEASCTAGLNHPLLIVV